MECGQYPTPMSAFIATVVRSLNIGSLCGAQGRRLSVRLCHTTIARRNQCHRTRHPHHFRWSRRAPRNSFGPFNKLRLRVCRCSAVAERSSRRSMAWPARAAALSRFSIWDGTRGRLARTPLGAPPSFSQRCVERWLGLCVPFWRLSVMSHAVRPSSPGAKVSMATVGRA